MLAVIFPLLLVGLGLSAMASDDDDSDVVLNDNDESLTGTGGDDLFDTAGGDDTVFAGDGDDIIASGTDADRVFGGEGADLIFGQDGDDFLRGGAGNDLIFTGEGADTVFGDVGDDVIQSITTFDDAALTGSLQNPDAVNQVLDNFDLNADTGEGDVVNGGVGSDLMLFGAADTVSGGSGDDIFATGFYLDPESPATITDFDASSEVLIYEYETGTNPTIEFVENEGVVSLQVDGADVVFLDGIDFQTLSESNLDARAV